MSVEDLCDRLVTVAVHAREVVFEVIRGTALRGVVRPVLEISVTVGVRQTHPSII